MAYADLTFYQDEYFGDLLTEDNAAKWLERASDWLDVLTRGRLTFAFPTVSGHIAKVKKAVCAMAEALFSVDEQRKALMVQKAADGSYKGTVASISSGKESITYLSGSSATSSSVYAAAAADSEAETKLVLDTAVMYLAGIPDANGINLLYAGGDPCVQ